MARASSIWKPGTTKGPVLLLPSDTPRGTVTITTEDGRSFTGRYLNTNEGRHQYVFPREVAGLQNLTVNANGQSGTIKSGSQSYEGSDFSSWVPRDKGSIGSSGSAGVPGAVNAGSTPDIGNNGSFTSVDTTTAPEGVAFPVAGGAPQFPTVTPQPIPQVQVPFVDPRHAAQQYAADNAQQLGENFGTASSEATSLTQLDANAIKGFAPQAEATQQSLIASENPFNQTQVANANAANEPAIRAANKGNQADRLQQLDAALPGARDTILHQIDNNKTLSEGRFLSNAEDRAFEVAARGTAADTATTRGFGDDSTVGKRTSDMLSAAQRLQLSQTGQAGLDRFLQLGANLAFDQPIKFNPIMNDPNKANVSKDIRGTPPTAASTLAVQEQNRLDPLTTINPATGIGLSVGQNQFQGTLDQNRNEFNSTQNVQAQQFNATGTYNAALEGFTADVFNAQQEAGAINQGHAVDTAQDNASTGTAIGIATNVIGTAATIGSLLLKPGATSTTPGVAVSGATGASDAAGTAETAGTVGANAGTGFGDLGTLGKPLAVSLAASGAGKSIEDTIAGINDGSITEKDLKKGLAKAGLDSNSVSGLADIFKGGVTPQEAARVSLLANPATAGLAAADMLGDKSVKTTQAGDRNTLRKFASQVGLFFKNSEDGAYYTRLADGTEVNVSNDGKKKLQNFGTNIDGKSDRSTFQIDWSDPRTPKAVGYYNSLGVMIFGKDYDKMAGHVINAAESNNNSLAETKANFQAMADEASIDYKTGLKLLAKYKEAGTIPESRYPAVVAGWNELMLTQGVDKNVTV